MSIEVVSATQCGSKTANASLIRASRFGSGLGFGAKVWGLGFRVLGFRLRMFVGGG